MSRSEVAAPPRAFSVVLIGNPNTGKTTLFNALTGLRHRVGNYPGVTVETKTGSARTERGTLSITDVPGAYSLTPRSPDEMLAVELILGHRPEMRRPDVVVCILDASNLERNLYLATQVLELGLPTVLALNMIDVAEARGIGVDADALSQALGAPVVKIQATSGRGLRELKEAIERAASAPVPAPPRIFPAEFQREVEALARWLGERGHPNIERFLVERALLDSSGMTERALVERTGPELRATLAAARSRLAEAGCPVPAVEARARYAWIAEKTRGAIRRPAARPITWSDRIDRVLIHRVWGLAFFLLVMAVVFQSIYTWAALFMDPIALGFESLGEAVAAVLPEGPLRELIVHGVIAGVGNVLIFLPQIVILFGFLAILEDCGYMARAAFLMDKLMARSGLSGKSFIPLLSSFACAIPGIMATRTIEDRRDRLATIVVAPLMSCSARLPVYVLLIGAFIPAVFVLPGVSLRGLVLLSMYLIGLVLAPLVAWCLKRSLLRGAPPVFLMELPSYKVPSLGNVLHRMYERGMAFVTRAGTLILFTTVIVWALQYYPRPASVEERFAAQRQRIATLGAAADATPEEVEAEARRLENRIAAAYQEQSFLGRFGKAIEPAVRPLGWDWRIGMAAIASFPAREVVVSALGTIFSVGADVDEESLDLQDALRAAKWPDERPLFNIPTALSLMVFFALCCQCGATLAILARETNSWRWPVFTFLYMTILAYLGALVVYQVGIRLAG